VQSIEFTQIEMKVMEGLQVGNECLNKMHQVGPRWWAGMEEGPSGAASQDEFVPEPGHEPGWTREKHQCLAGRQLRAKGT
jgi:hypothetical protein